MLDKRSSVASDEARIDHAILCVLLYQDARWPWSVEEVARKVGDPIATTDALARLYGAGLVYRLGGFVFPTRAAARYDQLPS